MAGYCGQWTRVGEAEQEVVLVPIRCRSWACEVCGPRNKRRLLRRLTSATVGKLITLTASRKEFSCPDHAFRSLSVAVPHLVKRIKRRFPAASFQYLLIWERTKAGWPHAHILCRTSFLPQRWLSAQWAELAGSPVVDIRAVTSPRAVANYVSKYLSKDPYAPRRMKRYRTSRAFFDEPGGLLGRGAPTKAVWHTRYFPVFALLHEYPALLFALEPQSSGAVVCRPRPPPDLAASGLNGPTPRQERAPERRAPRGLGAGGYQSPLAPPALAPTVAP